jgi:hypothetical protein
MYSETDDNKIDFNNIRVEQLSYSGYIIKYLKDLYVLIIYAHLSPNFIMKEK